jgi:SAM-dependent methyltransferase
MAKLPSPNKMFTRAYEISDFPWFSLERFKIQRTLELINAVKQRCVLDIGCGKGIFSKHLASSNTVYACDLDDFYNEFKDTKVVFIQHDIQEGLPFKDKFFDVVLASHILEHLKDVEFVLDEIHRVLKNNGILIIGLPNTSWNIQNILIGSLVPIYDFFRKKLRKIKPEYSYKTFKKGRTEGIKKWFYVIDTYLKMMEYSKNAHICKFSCRKWSNIFERHSFKIEKLYGIGLFPFTSFLPINFQQKIYEIEKSISDTTLGVILSSYSLFILRKVK